MPLKRSNNTLDTTQVSQEFKKYRSPISNWKHFLTFTKYLVHLLKSKNQFGKLQSDIDLAADDIIFKHLKSSGVVFGAASEEKPNVSEFIE